MELEAIKLAVNSIIKERDELASSQPDVMPSKYWQYFSARTKYLLDLSEESLVNIRYHTYHLTTDLYQRYALGNPDTLLQTGALNWETWLGLTEPDNGIGFTYIHDGKAYKISTDLINTNRNIRRMVGYGALQFVGTQQIVEIVEIGAGYGGLAYQLIKWLGKRVRIRYYIVDLPEILLFSAVYFKVNMPEARLYIYNPDEPMPSGFNDYDVVLIPNYKVDILKTSSNIKLIINIAAFQEMTLKQVRDYLELAKVILADDGCLYSWNMDRNPANSEPDLNVLEMLLHYFDVTHIDIAQTKKRNLREQTVKVLKAIAEAIKLIPAPAPFYPAQDYKGYICRRKRDDE